MTEPTDPKLYQKMKDEVDKSYKKPSAYRSMAYQRYYLKAFAEKYGDKKKAFKGKNPEELDNWRNQNWLDVRSVLKNPKKPTACGNEPVGEGEYPFCMKEKDIKKYSKGELTLLQNRKNEIGDTRLVKDAFLRDILKPEETPPERIYKEKYVTEKKLKLPKPLPKARREKILAEPNISLSTTEAKVPKPRGRPKLAPDVLKANQEATLQRRREQRQKIKQENQQKRAEARKAKAEEKARAKAEAMPKVKAPEPAPTRPIYNPRATGQEALDYDTQMAKFTDYEISKGRIVTNPKPYKLSFN